MKILVMGSGAIGGYFGAVLHKAGHDVTFVERGEHLEAIQQRGLRIESLAAGNFTIHPEATAQPDGSFSADMALFCVKGYDNAQAITIMEPAVGENTSILTLQNGIGSGEVLASAFGREKVLLGVTYADVTRKVPGLVVEDGTQCNIIFGPEDGRRSPRAVEVYKALQGAGVDTELSTNVTGELWKKLTYICALSGMTCITRSAFSEVLEIPETLDLTWNLMREVEAVAKARGVDLDEGVPDSFMAQFQEAQGRITSSMYTDLQQGRPLEVEVLNGAVARLGNELGVDTPINSFIATCLTVAHRRAMA